MRFISQSWSVIVMLGAALWGVFPTAALGDWNELSASDYVGTWVGHWDDNWCVQFTITPTFNTPADDVRATFSVRYEVEERLGQPLLGRVVNGRLFGSSLLVGDRMLISLSQWNKEQATAYYFSEKSRVASLHRNPSTSCRPTAMVPNDGKIMVNCGGGKCSTSSDSIEAYRQAIMSYAQRIKKYPRMAMDKQFEGTAVVHVAVRSESRNQECSIGQSSGHGILDEEATQLIKRSVAVIQVPVSLGHQDFSVDIPVMFTLNTRVPLP